jgi:zinc D-Ala-D-Ala carboxypeptidase
MSNIQLSDHFTLDEMVLSQTAAREGIDNQPGPREVNNLRRVAALLEQVRALLGNRPVHVSSGYRCPALNAKVKGAKNSAHLQGLAVDFTVPAFGTPRQVAEALARSGLPFDQLIYEYGSWVHLGLCEATQTPRRQVLTYLSGHSGAIAGITDTSTALA